MRQLIKDVQTKVENSFGKTNALEIAVAQGIFLAAAFANSAIATGAMSSSRTQELSTIMTDRISDHEDDS
jgi:hypothetical protein